MRLLTCCGNGATGVAVDEELPGGAGVRCGSVGCFRSRRGRRPSSGLNHKRRDQSARSRVSFGCIWAACWFSR
jgi:hypothetical protein